MRKYIIISQGKNKFIQNKSIESQNSHSSWSKNLINFEQINAFIPFSKAFPFLLFTWKITLMSTKICKPHWYYCWLKFFCEFLMKIIGMGTEFGCSVCVCEQRSETKVWRWFQICTICRSQSLSIYLLFCLFSYKSLISLLLSCWYIFYQTDAKCLFSTLLRHRHLTSVDYIKSNHFFLPHTLCLFSGCIKLKS